MTWIYFLCKFLHILSVITALGAKLTYGFLAVLGERKPEHLVFTLRSIHWLDSRVANPGYILTLITGLLLVWVKGYPFASVWILYALILFGLVALLGITVYAPIIRKQVKFAEENKIESLEYRQIRSKSTALGIIIIVMVLVILFLMVVKPV